MTWWTIIVRLLITAAMGWATFKLLREEVTVPKYTAAMPGLFLIALLWIADLEHSARIVAGFFEIDRRVELAQDAIRRLDELTKKAANTEANLSELVERETLRRWAMILPSGRVAVNPAGHVSTPGSPFENLYQNIFKAANGGWKWECDDEILTQLAVLTEREPQVPYAAVARAACLKQRGDTSWRAEAERIKGQLEKLKGIEPHVTTIDYFYKFCVELLG